MLAKAGLFWRGKKTRFLKTENQLHVWLKEDVVSMSFINFVTEQPDLVEVIPARGRSLMNF